MKRFRVICEICFAKGLHARIRQQDRRGPYATSFGRHSPTDLVKPAANNTMDAQDGHAATRQFTVSIGDGYGTTICTFETLPLVPLKCTGIRKGSRDSIPLGYTFSWAWKNKNALVKGGVSKHPSEGTALVQMECSNLAGDSHNRVSASGCNPNSVLKDLVVKMREAGWSIGEKTKINAWKVIGLDQKSICTEFIKSAPEVIPYSICCLPTSDLSAVCSNGACYNLTMCLPRSAPWITRSKIPRLNLFPGFGGSSRCAGLPD